MWNLTRGQSRPSGSVQRSNEFERAAAFLESSGEYRVLRRLKPLPRLDPSRVETSLKGGVFVDVETTGLDPVRDEIVDFAMVHFWYSIDGVVLGLGDRFEALRDPGRPIPPAVTSLTGITGDMVSGRTVDCADVAEFIAPAALVVAHNSAFDRRFCERLCPVFAEKAWACSLRDVPWNEEGFVNGAKLASLAAAFGFFYDGHRAAADCHAGIFILSQILPRTGRTVLSAVLQSARLPRWRVWARGAPFALRESMKRRGYRWNDGTDGQPRSWFADVEEEALEAEMGFLRQRVYGRDDIDVDVRRITAFERYSVRC
ncbi:MAG: polymerase subunit epsilon [Frankiales bacterium]|jgi:DNA polymerase-3 subunit epsilon|nr:polymerase subunit epsilon [Frankiales bacterium]